MTNRRIYDLVMMAMFLTIIIILTLTPLGYPPMTFLPVGPTIVHIPVLVACIYFGLKKGSLVGLFFGLSSWYVAMTRAAEPLDFAFRNPLVSVLPRVLFAVATVYIYRFTSRRMNDKLAMGVSVTLGTIIHTLLVVSSLGLFGLNHVMEAFKVTDINAFRSIMILVPVLIGFNTIFEVLFAVFLVPPIVYALKTINKKNNSNTLKIED